MAADGRVLALAFAVHLLVMLAAGCLMVFVLRGEPAAAHPDGESGEDDGPGAAPIARDRRGRFPRPAARRLPEAQPASLCLRGPERLSDQRPQAPRRPERHREPIRQPVDSA